MTWDACSAGRVARDERFAFLTLSGRTRISSKDIPRAVDGCDISGGDLLGGEPFGGYSYLRTLYVLALEDLSPLAEALHALLGSTPRVFESASVPETCLCAVRILDAPRLPGAERLPDDSADIPEHTAPAREVW